MPFIFLYLLRGHNIGIRLIDEFLAKSGKISQYFGKLCKCIVAVTNCQNFRETAEMIAKVAFKMFLGITADIVNWNTEYTAFSLVLAENPLSEFVELPPHYQNLSYSNVLCGVIKGALEMVQLQVIK